MTIDVSKLTFAEITALQEQLEQSKAQLEQEAKATARTEIKRAEETHKEEVRQLEIDFRTLCERIAASHGFSLDALTGHERTTTRAPARPQFKNPNGTQTWTGKGKRPIWFNDLMESERLTADEAKDRSRIRY
ncbi:MAG: H-NS histone family protein [Rhodobacteraceae bacterium]|nr:H-NS histone family protein [Paracoccaceae bacterium]